MPNRIELVVAGRNASAAALTDAHRDVMRFVADVDRSMGSTLRSTETVAESFRGIRRDVRSAALGLSQDLLPALRQTGSDLTRIATTAAFAGSAIGALVLTGVSAVAVFGGRLIEAWQKNRQEIEAFSAAIRHSDLGQLGSQAEGARRELLDLRVELEKVNAEIAKRQTPAGRIPGIPTIGPQIQAGQLEQRREVLEGRLETLAQILGAQGLQQADIDRILRERREGFQAGDRAAQLQRAQAGLLDALLDPIERALLQMEREARELESPLQPSDPTAPRILLRDFVAIGEDFADQVKQASENTPFAVIDEGTVGGLGRVGIRTFLPISRAGEAAGQDITVSADFFRNLPPAVAAELWRRLLEVDFDMQLGIQDRRRFSGEV